MTYDSDSPVKVVGKAVYAATEKALLIARDGMDERSNAFAADKAWVPLAFLDHPDNELLAKDDAGDLIVPRWIAEKNEWQWEYV